jgi:hypothetical protein
MNKAAGTFDGDADNSSMLPGCAVGPVIVPGEEAEGGRAFVALRTDLPRQASALNPTLLLSKGRVEVGLTWRSQYDGSTGTSLATPINDGFGFLSFTDPANPEVFVKVLDFGSAGALLLFYGGLTDFEYEVTYRNLCTNQTVVFKKPAGSKAGGADNKSMYAVCDQGPLSPNLAAIQSVEAKCMSLSTQGLSRLDYIRAVAAYMATLPAYAGTGVDEASLTAYGIFQDGRVHLVVNNREFSPLPAVRTGKALRNSAQAASVVELPASGWARLLQSFGTNRLEQEPVSDIAGWLESPGGYAIRAGQEGDARLTALRAVSGDGFLYFNTHGGRAWRNTTQTGPRFYSLQSSTIVTPATEQQPEIKDDMAAGRLTYFTAPTGDTTTDYFFGVTLPVSDTRYGITGDFVAAYWHLSPNSIVFLNACWSAYTAVSEGPQDFIDACWGAGAAVVFGWNEKANSDTCFNTVRYFVDRLVGANKFMKESPDQRAFPWDLVYPDMVKHGLTHDSKTGADLVAFPRPGGPSAEILDPSIQDVIVNEWAGTLKLHGSFGTSKGKVTVGPEELAGCTWAGDTIECTLPLTGPGSNGDVIVEIQGQLGRTRKSNIRQLTEWDIPLHYLWSDVYGYKGMKFEGNGTLRFRADVGSYRDKPGTPPIFPIRGMFPTKDSSFPVTGSGFSTYSDCTLTLSGSGIFPVYTALGGASPPLVLFTVMKVDTNTPHQGALSLGFGGDPGTWPFKATWSGKICSGSFLVACTFGRLDGPDYFPSSPDDNSPLILFPMALSLTFDGQFRIPRKTFTDTREDGQITVEWTQDIEPISPPKPDESR